MIPKISVIIPSYNSDKWIGRCLRSILNQTFDKKFYEVILINDGSNYSLTNIIKPFIDDIIYINRKENKGLPYSLNEGIKIARGRYIIRLDSDDYVHEDYLKIPYLYLTLNDDSDAVALDYYKVDENEKIISRHNSINQPIGCGIMFKHEQMIELGLYNEKQKLHEEKELMVRFNKKYKLDRIPLPLYRYRFLKNSLSKNKDLIKKFGETYEK